MTSTPDPEIDLLAQDSGATILDDPLVAFGPEVTVTLMRRSAANGS